MFPPQARQRCPFLLYIIHIKHIPWNTRTVNAMVTYYRPIHTGIIGLFLYLRRTMCGRCKNILLFSLSVARVYRRLFVLKVFPSEVRQLIVGHSTFRVCTLYSKLPACQHIFPFSFLSLPFLPSPIVQRVLLVSGE